MITNNTVFILGAGASKPFGLPLGEELVTKIGLSLSGNDESDIEREITDVTDSSSGIYGHVGDSYNRFIRMLCELGHKLEEIEIFRESLNLMQLNSIDSFLEHRPELIPIGKQSIAYNLLKYENEKNLYGNSDWYRYIWNAMNCKFDDFHKNQVAFITFNYDRTLEYYLMNAMKSTYGKSEDVCFERLQNIPILHVHGKLGNLAWEDKSNFVNFGEKITEANQLSKSADSIKIIHENFGEDIKIFDEAFKLLKKSNNVHFLGFGYSSTNLDRLKISHILGLNLKGTGFGLTSKERVSITNKYSGLSIETNPTFDCLKYLKERVYL